MQTNMGSIDRIIRILVAVVVIILYFTNMLAGPTALILLGLSGVFILTSFIGFCPIYYPFNLSTKKNKE